jgi:hypothetical protein
MGWVWVFFGYFWEWGRHFGGIWDVGGWGLDAGMEEEKWGVWLGRELESPILLGWRERGSQIQGEK